MKRWAQVSGQDVVTVVESESEPWTFPGTIWVECTGTQVATGWTYVNGQFYPPEG